MSEFINKNFVCMGIRLSTTDKKLVEIGVLNETSDKIEEVVCLPFTRNSNKVVGAIYKGASFSKDKVSNINKAIALRVWQNDEDILIWEVKQKQALTRLADLTIAKKIKPENMLEVELKKLKEFYDKLKYCDDKRAFENLILDHLRG